MRYTPADFVLTKPMCFAGDAPKTSLQGSYVHAIARRAAEKARR